MLFDPLSLVFVDLKEIHTSWTSLCLLSLGLWDPMKSRGLLIYPSPLWVTRTNSAFNFESLPKVQPLLIASERDATTFENTFAAVGAASTAF